MALALELKNIERVTAVYQKKSSFAVAIIKVRGSVIARKYFG